MIPLPSQICFLQARELLHGVGITKGRRQPDPHLCHISQSWVSWGQALLDINMER